MIDAVMIVAACAVAGDVGESRPATPTAGAGRRKKFLDNTDAERI